MLNYPYPPETDPEEAQRLQDIAMNASCAGDCTGLIPAISGDDDDMLDSYAEMYGFLPPREK